MTRSTAGAGGGLRTADVVRETGYSAQQVRDLERLGVVPPAVREPNGYRVYTAVHVRALRAYRGVAAAAGPVEARRLLTDLFAAPDPTAAVAAVNAVHARLAHERDEVLRALAALDAVRDEPPGDDAPVPDVLTITELAGALGVRTSTLRFWEQEGLVHPDRVTSLRARQYGAAAIREARVVGALRTGGYGIPAVREVIRSLDTRAGVAASREILGRRLDQIAARTLALLRAGADLAAVLDPL